MTGTAFWWTECTKCERESLLELLSIHNILPNHTGKRGQKERVMEDVFLGHCHFSAPNLAGTLMSEEDTELVLNLSSSWKCLLKQITVVDTCYNLILILYNFSWNVRFHLCPKIEPAASKRNQKGKRGGWKLWLLIHVKSCAEELKQVVQYSSQYTLTMLTRVLEVGNFSVKDWLLENKWELQVSWFLTSFSHRNLFPTDLQHLGTLINAPQQLKNPKQIIYKQGLLIFQCYHSKVLVWH